jgi:Ser/Thr protein kinase RdoA (MazF antagonist)
VSIQPCIRDIHREHVLFENDTVTGIIDFGSMKPDCVACDIARLLGSMALDDKSLWHEGLEAYENVRPLSQIELSQIEAYDQTAVLLSGINWLQWAFVDNRKFENHQAVLQRFEVITQRLANLTRSIASET